MWQLRVTILVLGLVSWSSAGAEVSPLNLSPGFPTQLDDAYPINKGNVVVQPAFRFDKVESQEVRVRQTVDVRWGVVSGLEVFAGGTTAWGPLHPGTVDDPRGVRVGLLYRFNKQQEGDLALPSLGIRVTGQVPVTGPWSEPSARTELLASWDLGSQWWGHWWAHANVGFQVTPEVRPGLQSVGQRSIWYGRAGLVRAFTSELGGVASVTYGQDPTQAGAYVWTPEVGLMWAIRPEWILTTGAGHDFGSSPHKSTFRGNMAITWVW